MGRTAISRKLLILGVCLVVGACAVQGTDKEVSIEYPTAQFAIAENAAERHCAKFDRAARLVQTLPATPKSSVLFLQTRTSVFECVER